METSEELEWELYDIFISGIFAFPIYEHNAARRVVRYLLMRGILDEEIASAIEGPTVDLRIWLNRGGKHLVGEWVIAWLNDSRDQYKNRRRTTAGRSRGRLRDRRRRKRRIHLYGEGGGEEEEEERREESPFSVQTYLSSSSATHRSSFSSDSSDSRWTKEEDESDISSDYDLDEDEEVDDNDVEVEGVDGHAVQRRSIMEEVEAKVEERRPHDSQTLKVLVESSHADYSEPHYKLHRPQTLNFDPDTMSLMKCLPMTTTTTTTTTGLSSAIDDPDSGHVSDTPCSCLLLHCLHSSVHNDDDDDNDDDNYGHPSAHAHHADDDASLPVYCSACRSRLPLYEKIASDAAHQMACAGCCRNDESVAMDTDDDGASADAQQRCHEVTTA